VSAPRRYAKFAATLALFAVASCSPDRTAVTEAPLGDASSSAQAALDVRVSLASNVEGNAPVIATVSVTNISNTTVDISEDALPSEDMETAQFLVLRDGSAVAFDAPHIKRGPTAPAVVVHIGAGETLRYDIELSRAYDFSRSGGYSVEFDTRGSTSRSSALRSSRARVDLTGRTTLRVDPNAAALTSSLSYVKCSDSQQSQLVQALIQAETYSQQAKGYLNGGVSDRYTWWFGPSSSSNVNTVRNNFNAITDAFANKAITIDCGCKKQYYAYVYSNQPYRIYVCRAFWSAPLAGTDSRGGTLIHEMSHFTVVAGTEDWAYGQSAAHDLALTNPLRAIDNADSHEYFAENTPARR
jgi:peptidyl-Lys metalloendopeptidase